MARNKRQLKLIEIINNNNVETQTELINLLQMAGFSVTQATISRDINDLGITKVIMPNRRYKYVCPQEEKVEMTNKYNNLFKEAVISIKSAKNIVVVKTIIGSANSAAAFIDNLEITEIIGSLAGDDTIFLVVVDDYSAELVKRKLNAYLV
ncbi:MAG: arginine repressor [Clostridia bacterium]|nr:arginine repressor [Clostridia bacterium]